ncbi:hypothetical protein [Pseudoflavonifractor sp. An85]|uniref:hypothetical protein n=1 Tax=Pseudoflavonifractor sp. An85 TaxID=1965661 RepID=UPI00130270E9|nr:hypothetical protein [Pseudoflavonifractor sp. An85]
MSYSWEDHTSPAEPSLKTEAIDRLMSEVQKGWNSVEKSGWYSEADAYHLLGIEL